MCVYHSNVNGLRGQHFFMLFGCDSFSQMSAGRLFIFLYAHLYIFLVPLTLPTQLFPVNFILGLIFNLYVISDAEDNKQINN